MLLTAEITEPPISGKYPEKIYDATFSTEDWTWIKFEDENYDTFYGQFRGKPRSVAISSENQYCYVLTDTFLYELNRDNPDDFQVKDFIDDVFRTIRNITLSPNGKLILSDYYTIFIINSPICQISGRLEDALIEIENPFSLDEIEFKEWENNLLHISAITFIVGEPINLIYNATINVFLEDVNNNNTYL